MKKFKEKGFTLIELIAVLVIMAILALIVTPLVMNIIRKARISADKRSVDAYGRSIELAIAGYLLDTGKFPTEISQLTIEYSGNKVECETTQINTDSSVYLAGCKVAGRSTGDYVYGKEELKTYETYSVGDEVTYNGVDYYVLKDSGSKDTAVTLLKAEPLSVEEVNTYGGVGTANNHVNMYSTSSEDSYYRTAYNNNGYGGMAYYSSSTCGYDGNNWSRDNCKTEYIESHIKHVVDGWKDDNLVLNDIINVRLITLDELLSPFGYEEISISCGGPCTYNEYDSDTIPNWLYNSNYSYWTMSADKINYSIWYVKNDGVIGRNTVDTPNVTVRPVVELYKNDGITRKNS